MNYLVTGAAGFIGFHTVKKLLDGDHAVFGIDSLNDYYDLALKYNRLKELGVYDHDKKFCKSNKYPNFYFSKIEIENNTKLLDQTLSFISNNGALDCIINLAAQAGVRYSLENPFAYTKSNIDGFLSVLELSRKIKIPHLVYASSSSVYGLNKKIPFSVDDEVNSPASLYAASKRSNELMAHTYSHLYGIPVTGLRFFTVYGPWGRPDMAYYKFTKSIIENNVIDVYNNGDMQRDFSYIDDVTDGIILAAGRPSLPSAPCELYNLGNNKPVKLIDFIETLERILGKKAAVNYLPMQAGDVYLTYADIDKTKKELGWQPQTNLEDGLKNFTAWYREYNKE